MVWGSWSSAATQTEGNPKVKIRDRKMKRTLLTLVTTSLVLVAEAAETNELEKTESGGLTVEASVDVLSDYIWRGTICNGNPVWQPSATIGYDAGDFGTVNLIQENFGSFKEYDERNRFFNPNLAGGAMLDIGIYSLTLMRLFMESTPNRPITTDERITPFWGVIAEKYVRADQETPQSEITTALILTTPKSVVLKPGDRLTSKGTEYDCHFDPDNREGAWDMRTTDMDYRVTYSYANTDKYRNDYEIVREDEA